MTSNNFNRRGSKASFADVCTLESLFRHKWIFLSVFLSGLLLTGFVLFGRDRTFESLTRVFIRLGRESVPDSTTSVTGQSLQASDPQKREIQSAIDMIKSDAMLEGIVDTIGVEQILSYSDEFTEKNAPNPVVAILKAQIPKIKEVLAAIRLADPDNRRAKALTQLGKQIKASSEEHSNILSVRVKSESPKLSQEIGKVIISKFQELHREAHRAPGAYDFFEEQLAKVKVSLEESMAILRDSKNEAGISSIADQKQILTERLKSVDLAISQAYSEYRGTTARIDQMQTTLDSIPERVLSSEVNGLTNTSRDDMRGSLYKLELEYAELRSKLTDENPVVIKKKRQLEEAKSVYGTEEVDPQKTMAVSTTHQEVKLRHYIAKADEAGATARVEELRKQHEDVLTQIREINRKELEIETLSRDIAVLNDKYRKYSESLEQARIDEALQQDNMSSVNVVQLPSFNDDPIDTSNTIVAVIGIVGSVFCALGAAFGRRYMRNELSNPDDIERELEIPVLATIPSSRQRRVQFN
jgi:uncharacterized protein involved in exopolysaccharide biosynthesis